MPRSRIRRYLKHGTLTQMGVFEAVARHASFTRAAEELHMAQPTVSVQIRKLAETVGAPLFEQIGRKIHLTEAGRQIRNTCDEVFAALSRLEDSLESLRGLRTGTLRLAVSTTGKYFVPRLLSEFVKTHPGIEVSLQIHPRSALVERLARNEDDLYVFANPPTDQEIVTQTILANPMVAYARADHPLAGEHGISFTRFAQEPFLMREQGSGTRMVAQELFARHGLAPKVRMELSTNEAVRQAILAGLGVSILSRDVHGLDVDQPGLAMLDVEGLPLERHWHFVYPVGKQLSPAAQAFMELARREGKELALPRMVPAPAPAIPAKDSPGRQ